MWTHYFKLAIRSIWKNKLFSGINLFGLSVGIACFLLMAAYAWKEYSVNKYLRNADQQYIIQSKWKKPGMGLDFTTIGQLPVALKENYPQLVANYYRFDGVTSTVSKGNTMFREGLQIGDSTLLTMYGFDLKYGDPRTALERPFSLVMTTEKAQKYFNREDVIGETLTIENFSGARSNFTITGILEKNSQNSITTFDKNNDSHFFIPKNTLDFFGRSIDAWTNIYTLAYVELQEGVDPKELEKPMQQLIAEHTQSYISENLEAYLLPLTDYYLDSNGGLIRKMLLTLAGITLFILLMAVINFVNLVVSQANLRMKEIGVRKVLGSLRRELMLQFYVECFLLVSIATIIGLGIYHISSPFASSFLANAIPAIFEFNWTVFPLLLVFVFSISLLAGTYPALILSSFRTLNALKGQLTKVKDSVLLRKSLLSFQFGLAMIVLISATIIAQQIDYFFSKDLGYDKEYIVYASLPRDWSTEGVQRMQQIREQLGTVAAIEDLSLSYSVPNGNNAGQPAIYHLGADSTTAITTESIIVDRFYAKTYNLELHAGKFFEPFQSDAPDNSIVINEASAKALGWQNASEAIGQQVKIVNNPNPLQIKGIVGDYHYGSLRETIKPAIFMNVELANFYRYFSIKLKPGNVQQALAEVQQKWASLLPNTPFDYEFIDETLAGLYASELRLQKAASTATVLAIIIALLGIFGLLTISLQQRTKEIGIRKVIGAGPQNIIHLFLKDFFPLVLIAGLIAWPVSWYLMQEWLKNYQYPILLTVWPFLLSLLFLVGIATLLIILQCLRASAMNPVEAIRQE